MEYCISIQNGFGSVFITHADSSSPGLGRKTPLFKTVNQKNKLQETLDSLNGGNEFVHSEGMPLRGQNSKCGFVIVPSRIKEHVLIADHSKGCRLLSVCLSVCLSLSECNPPCQKLNYRFECEFLPCIYFQTSLISEVCQKRTQFKSINSVNCTTN